jgi:hypothetical protein
MNINHELNHNWEEFENFANKKWFSDYKYCIWNSVQTRLELNKSFDKLVFKFRSKVTEKIVNGLSDCVCSSQDSAEMDQKDKQVLAPRHDFHYKSAYCIVEVHDWWLVIDYISILLVGILVSVVSWNSTLEVPGWHNINMIMNWPPSLFNHILLLKQMQSCVWVPAFYCI